MALNPTGSPIKELVESKGAQGAQEVIREGLKQKKFQPEHFSLQEIWEATCGPVSQIQEQVVADSFPKITGELINAKIIAGYDSVAMIGDQLCTTVPSKLKTETVAGFTDAEVPDFIPEAGEYNDSTVTEKYVTMRNKKYGKLISITEEMILFDQSGQVMTRAQRIGEKAAQYREKTIVEGVQDINSSVWNPSGVATAFYSATNGNLATSNAFNEGGLEAVRKLMQQMKDDSEHSDSNDYILINEANMILLVPVDLELEAWQMVNSTLTPESAENASNFFRGRYRVLTSPYVTNQSATTWFLGDFRQDFWWSEVWPLQTFSRAAGNSDEFKRDIKSMHKVRYYGTIGAVDVRHSFKSTA